MGINSTTDMQDAYIEIYKILQREIKYINEWRETPCS